MIRVTEYRMGKPKTVTDKPLKRPKPNDPLELSLKLQKADSTEARRVLVGEVMTELFYVWGEECRPWKDYLTYEQNINELYIGEKHGDKTTEQN
jgi:hypothetical protein